jgi:hypothetical protein
MEKVMIGRGIDEEPEFSPMDKFLAELDNVGWGSAPVGTMREMIVTCLESTSALCIRLAGDTPLPTWEIAKHFDLTIKKLESFAVKGLERMGKG